MEKTIAKTNHRVWLLSCLGLAGLLAACTASTTTPPAASPMSTGGVAWEIPLTTDSASAREHFRACFEALDRGRAVEAKGHCEKATAADPEFALAHFGAALASPSVDEFAAHLKIAEQKAARASEAERLLIEDTRRAFANDQAGRLEAAQRLVQVAPRSPRAHLALAGALTAMDRDEEARQAAEKAAQLAPRFVPAHVQLINLYMFSEPRDFSKADKHARTLVDVAPDQAQSHDFLGDVARALGHLEQARAAYTRAAELDSENGLALQQRGHVNSFLGNYRQARADYDAAISAADPNTRASYGVYRALVSAYEGRPQATVSELDQLVRNIDGMNIEDREGPKIFARSTQATIAMHSGNYAEADAALDEMERLMEKQAQDIGREEFARNQRIFAAYLRGRLAVQQTRYDDALSQAARIEALAREDRDPLADQNAHALRGYVALAQGDAQQAIMHLEKSSLANVYNRYSLALAQHAAGQRQKSAQLFREVANYNFNNADFAVARKDAWERTR